MSREILSQYKCFTPQVLVRTNEFFSRADTGMGTEISTTDYCLAAEVGALDFHTATRIRMFLKLMKVDGLIAILACYQAIGALVLDVIIKVPVENGFLASIRTSRLFVETHLTVCIVVTKPPRPVTTFSFVATAHLHKKGNGRYNHMRASVSE